MLTLLQNPGTSFHLDGRVQEGLPGAKTLLEQSITPKLIKRKRKPIFVFGSISYNHECNLDLGKEWNATPGLLR